MIMPKMHLCVKTNVLTTRLEAKSDLPSVLGF